MNEAIIKSEIIKAAEEFCSWLEGQFHSSHITNKPEFIYKAEQARIIRSLIALVQDEKTDAVLEAADAYDQHWTRIEEKGSWKPLSLTDNSRLRDLRERVREWRKK